MDSVRVGAFIAALRREQGFTQKQLAEKIGVTDKAISRWETGKGYPDVTLLLQLGETLGVTLNELLSGRKSDFDPHKAYNVESEINNYRNQLKNQNIVDINNHEYNYAVGTMYMDVVGECEKLGDYVINVIQARLGGKQR